MTLAEQAERMAGLMEATHVTGWVYNDSGKPIMALRNPDGPEAAALLRQCAEALRKEGV